MTVELFGALNKSGKHSPIVLCLRMLGQLVELISNGTISGRIAKDVFADMFESGKTAQTIVDEKGLKQVSDSGAIETLIDQVLTANQDKVDQSRWARTSFLAFLSVR